MLSVRRPAPPLVLAMALLASVFTFAAPVVTAPAASAADCPAPHGGSIPRADKNGDVVFHGGGWGHGLGMSQYGAQGAANLGCSYEQILTTYYAGTQVVARQMPDKIRLRMLAKGYRVDVKAVEGQLTWVLPGCTGPTPENPAAPACPPVQPAGAHWQLTLDAATGQYVLWNLDVVPKTVVWQGGTAADTLQLLQNGNVARLTTWKGSSIYLDRWLRWDWTEFSMDSGLIDAVQQIGASPVGTAMDKYLWGIAEVPASFPAEALKAQAVAARTYAAKRADRVLMPTPADQNYTGWKKETEGPDAVWGTRWREAVNATSGQVIALTSTGALIDAFYSSSMGGHTEDERFVWGVENPWLRAVDDSAWDLASSNPAENRSWAENFTWGKLARKLGFQHVSDISVAARGSEARNAGVRVTGIRDGQLVTTYVEGWDVRQALGLLSPGFTVSYKKAGGKRGQPIAGDWDGDGTDEPGWFRDGRWALSMTASAGRWTKRFSYGEKGDIAVVGDWDQDGDDDIGVYRDGQWLLRDRQSRGKPTLSFQYGGAGDRPVVGSWNGRTVGMGVVSGKRWNLRRTLTSGKPQITFRYGRVSDTPVVGSWNGRGRTGIGVERDGKWLLRNRRSGGKAGIRIDFGKKSHRAVVGDWAGTGSSSIGMGRKRSFLLRDSLADDAGRDRLHFRG
jgi:stage II sporulation protein D